MFNFLSAKLPAIVGGTNPGGSPIQLDAVFQEILGLIPLCLPVVISCLALRKGLAFMFGLLRGA